MGVFYHTSYQLIIILDLNLPFLVIWLLYPIHTFLFSLKPDTLFFLYGIKKDLEVQVEDLFLVLFCFILPVSDTHSFRKA